MQLWLVRHAVAAERDEFDGPDGDRPLTPKGRRRFRNFCDWLAGETAMPQAILSSPLVRAAQTAAILAKSCGMKKTDVTPTDLLSPGVDVQQLLQFARAELSPAELSRAELSGGQAADCMALVG